MTASLRQRTTSAFIWSALQNVSVKLFTLLLFFVLVRFLSPADIGVAAVVTAVLAFVALLAEQGFQDGIVQRRELGSDDLNLPFVLSVLIALLCSAALLFLAADIARLLKADAAAPLIRLSALIPPLTAASGFQIAMRRRQLEFKTLARANLLATLVSGMVALGGAYAGMGASSLVLQAIVAAGALSALLWLRPAWRPGRAWSLPALRGILGYSSNIFASKLVDFFAKKIIEYLILARFGLAGLGVYTVGARLYLTLLQLLAYTLLDVSLAAMSRIVQEAAKLREVYLRFIFLACCSMVPLFLLCAALAPELSRILFGQQWDGVEQVMTYLFCLGAAEVVQYFNSAAQGARGRSRVILGFNVAKCVLGALSLWLVPADSIAQMTLHFVLSQFCVTPFIFWAGMRAVAARPAELLRQIWPGVLASLTAYASVLLLRHARWGAAAGVWAGVLLYGIVFGAVVLGMLVLTSRRRLWAEIAYLRGGLRRGD